jgi:hypothetical protein
VASYDAWIPNLADWDFLAEGQKNITNPYVQAATIQGLCPIIQQRCVGANQQYTEFVNLNRSMRLEKEVLIM